MALGLALYADESSKSVHLLVNGLDSRELKEEVLQSKGTFGFEILGICPQEHAGTFFIAILAYDLPAKGDEMVLDDSHDMEAIGDDAGVWKPFFDDGSIGVAKVDADHFDAFPAF